MSKEERDKINKLTPFYRKRYKLFSKMINVINKKYIITPNSMAKLNDVFTIICEENNI